MKPGNDVRDRFCPYTTVMPNTQEQRNRFTSELKKYHEKFDLYTTASSDGDPFMYYFWCAKETLERMLTE